MQKIKSTLQKFRLTLKTLNTQVLKIYLTIVFNNIPWFIEILWKWNILVKLVWWKTVENLFFDFEFKIKRILTWLKKVNIFKGIIFIHKTNQLNWKRDHPTNTVYKCINVYARYGKLLYSKSYTWRSRVYKYKYKVHI